MNVARRTLAQRSLVALAAALLLTACSGREAEDADDTSPAPATQDTASPTSSMAGMNGAGGSGTMEQLQTHMRMMDGAGADSIKAMLPMHREMVTNMLAQFDKDVRGMGMASSAAWSASVDSVRQDVIRMPAMTGPALQQSMAAHRSRVTRLMESHREMMGHMKK